MGTVRIAVIDEQALFREAVRMALETEPDLHVVAEASNAERALQTAVAVPDVVLVAPEQSKSGVVSTLRRITDVWPQAKIVVLADDGDHDLLLSVIETGASAYITKQSAILELVHAARAVHAGETLVPRQMLGQLLATLVRRKRLHDEAYRRLSILSARERQVLALLAQGGDNNAIARVLVISPQTARTHVQRVLRKLGVHSRLEAVAFVSQNDVREELASTVADNGKNGRPGLRAVPSRGWV